MSSRYHKDFYDYVLNMIINQYGYKEDSISKTFKHNDRTVHLSIFYENKPHLKENLFAVFYIHPFSGYDKKDLENGNPLQNIIDDSLSMFNGLYCPYHVYISPLEIFVTKNENSKYVISSFPINYVVQTPKTNSELIHDYDISQLLIWISIDKWHIDFGIFLLCVKLEDERQDKLKFNFPDTLPSPPVVSGDLASSTVKYTTNKSKNIYLICLNFVLKYSATCYDKENNVYKNSEFVIGFGGKFNKIGRKLALILQKYSISSFFEVIIDHYLNIKYGIHLSKLYIIENILHIMNPQKNDKIICPSSKDGLYLLTTLNYINEIPDELVAWVNDKDSNIDLQTMLLNVKFGKSEKIKVLNRDIFSFDSKDEESFDIVLIPELKNGREVIKDNVEKFELAYKSIKEGDRYYKTDKIIGQTLELLYLELGIRLLKPHGRLSIFITDGVLQNPSNKGIREYITRRCKIISVLSVYDSLEDTSMKYSLLILEKLPQIDFMKDKDYKVMLGHLKMGSEIIDSFNLFKSDQEEKITSNNVVIKNFSELSDRFDFNYHRKNRDFSLDNRFKPLYSLCEIVVKKSPELKSMDSDLFVNYVELSDVDYYTCQIVSYKTMKVSELPRRAYYVLKEGDLITGVSGHSIGTYKHPTAYVRKEQSGFICSNMMRVIRPNPTLMNSYFLLEYMKSKPFIEQIEKNIHGSATPSISDEALRNIMIIYDTIENLNEGGDSIKNCYDIIFDNMRLLKNLRVTIDNM